MRTQSAATVLALAGACAVLAGCGGSSGAGTAADASSSVASVSSSAMTATATTATAARRTTSRALDRSHSTTSSSTHTAIASTSVDTAALQERVYAALQKYVLCLRTHGIPNMPAPKSGGGGPLFNFKGTGIDLTGSKFKAATVACRSTLMGSVLHTVPSPAP